MYTLGCDRSFAFQSVRPWWLGRWRKEVGVADRVLFIGWEGPVSGREERCLGVFNEAIGHYGRLQQEGRIQSFDLVLLEPNGALGGYVELHGTARQLAAVREDEEFRRRTADAQLVVKSLRIIDGIANDGIAAEMAVYAEAVSKVPQVA
jgi:hypothetical protein